MNKYLKTYIRSRDIVIKLKQNPKEYELKYINTNNIDLYTIRNLLEYSIEPQKIIDVLGDKGKEFINNLDRYNIRYLLDNSTEVQKVMRLIKKYRPDYKI